jgi:hypothetical protein
MHATTGRTAPSRRPRPTVARRRSRCDFRRPASRSARSNHSSAAAASGPESRTPATVQDRWHSDRRSRWFGSSRRSGRRRPVDGDDRGRGTIAARLPLPAGFRAPVPSGGSAPGSAPGAPGRGTGGRRHRGPVRARRDRDCLRRARRARRARARPVRPGPLGGHPRPRLGADPAGRTHRWPDPPVDHPRYTGPWPPLSLRPNHPLVLPRQLRVVLDRYSARVGWTADARCAG